MEGRASPARLLIADDHDLFRAGVRAVLGKEPDLTVVGEARDGQEAVEMCRELRPDLVLMDVRMPRMDGIAATREIREEFPATVVLVVTVEEKPGSLLDAVRAGAAGYVLKDAAEHELMNAVRGALDGRSPLDGNLAMQLLKQLADERRSEREPLPEPLTPRELDVLRLLALGKTNPEVSDALHFGLSTVKGMVQEVIRKLGVADRTQAAVKAVELGLVPSSMEGLPPPSRNLPDPTPAERHERVRSGRASRSPSLVRYLCPVVKDRLLERFSEGSLRKPSGVGRSGVGKSGAPSMPLVAKLPPGGWWLTAGCVKVDPRANYPA